MDKNKFWLGGRLFNTASRLGAPTQYGRKARKMGGQMQRKARPQVGRPNATQGTSAMGTPTHVGKARPQGTHNASWPPQRERHVRKLGAPTQRKARPQDGRPTQNSSATKTSTQGSTRLKDELEDG
jgi:hypothetical protein